MVLHQKPIIVIAFCQTLAPLTHILKAKYLIRTETTRKEHDEALILKTFVKCNSNVDATAKGLKCSKKTIQTIIKRKLENTRNAFGSDYEKGAALIGYGWDSTLYKKKLVDYGFINREQRK